MTMLRENQKRNEPKSGKSFVPDSIEEITRMAVQSLVSQEGLPINSFSSIEEIDTVKIAEAIQKSLERAGTPFPDIPKDSASEEMLLESELIARENSEHTFNNPYLSNRKSLTDSPGDLSKIRTPAQGYDHDDMLEKGISMQGWTGSQNQGIETFPFTPDLAKVAEMLMNSLSGSKDLQQVNFQPTASDSDTLLSMADSKRTGESELTKPQPNSVGNDLFSPDAKQEDVDSFFKNMSSGLSFDVPVQYGQSYSRSRVKSHEQFDMGLGKGTFHDAHVYRKDFPVLQRKVHGKPLIWLDNAATTQKPKQVIDAVAQYYSEYNSNIHRGVHTLATEATDAYEEARVKIQRFMGASYPEEVIFVRGTTEGINLVAQTHGRRNIEKGDEIILTVLEHHSNIVPWQILAKERGAILKIAPVNARGEIMLEDYEALFSRRTCFVAMTHGSNAIGTIPPVKKMIKIAHGHDVPVMVDGAQSIPHMPVNVKSLDADFYAFSGHKLFGPMGIGIIYGKKHLLEDMPPWQGGGSMIKNVEFEHTEFNKLPEKFEAGTPNVAGAVGLGEAIDYLNKVSMANVSRYEKILLDYIEKELRTIPGLKIIGTAREKISVLSFIMDKIPSAAIGKELDAEGIAVREGHHCAQPILRHYGLTSTVRVSLAFYNTKEDIDKLVQALDRIRKKWM